jgi:hypothetical protein
VDRPQDVREVHGEANLAADSWARDVLAPEQSKTESQSIANRVGAADQRLELASAETAVVGEAAIDLAAQGQSRRKVVKKRDAAREYMPAHGCNSQYACAGVAGEQIAGVCVDPGLLGK